MTVPDSLVEAIEAWVHNVAFIREDGTQVAYTDAMIPDTIVKHDNMLREILKWQRNSKRYD